MTKWAPLVSLIVLVVGILAPITAELVMASYDYSYSITVFNNAATEYSSGVLILVTFNNSQLADYGYISATGLDTAVQEGATSRSFMVHSGKLGVFFPSFGGTQSRTITYRLGETPGQTSIPLIVGQGGSFSVADNDSCLEPGGNFSVEVSGYIDTSAGVGKNLAYKAGTLLLSVSGTNEISAYWTSTQTTNETLLVDGGGGIQQWNGLVGASTHWEAVDDPVGAPDNETTMVTNDGSGWKLDSFSLGNLSVMEEEDIVNSVTVWFQVKGWTSYQSYFKPYLELGSANITGAQYSHGISAWAMFNQIVGRPGGGNWTYDDFDNLIGGIWNSTTATNYLTQTYVTVNYTEAVRLVATDVSSGEHTIAVTHNGSTLSLYVDSVEEDSTSVGSLVSSNTTSNWVFVGGNSTRYMDYCKVFVNGTLQAWYEPVTMLAGGTLTDRQGGDHNGTISWGSNPSGFEISYGGLESYVSTTASVGEVEEEIPDLLPDFPTDTEYVPDPEDAELSSMPLYPNVTNAAESLGMTVRAAYVVLIWITCMVLGVGGMLAMGSVWGFIGGYAVPGVIALGTPVWPQMLMINAGFIMILGVYLWRHH